VFASGWGALVLDEVVTMQMLAGGAVIITGTVLALGLWPRATPATVPLASTAGPPR
jgi:drug/metabolite transporter (DMT)-like permease